MNVRYRQRFKVRKTTLLKHGIIVMSDQTGSLNESAPIISAAVLHNGIIHSMPAPNRHHNIVHAMNGEREKEGLLLLAYGEQGFLDANGNFLNRIDAAKVAEFWSQIKGGNLISAPNLYSEDLW